MNFSQVAFQRTAKWSLAPNVVIVLPRMKGDSGAPAVNVGGLWTSEKLPFPVVRKKR